MLLARLQAVHAALGACQAECARAPELEGIADLVAVLLEDFDDCMVAFARQPLLSEGPPAERACMTALCGILERIYAHECRSFEQRDALLQVEEACVAACMS